MLPRTHRQLVSVEVMWPAQTLPLPLQQVVEALNQGETPDQIIIRMNQRGLLAWRTGFHRAHFSPVRKRRDRVP